MRNYMPLRPSGMGDLSVLVAPSLNPFVVERLSPVTEVLVMKAIVESIGKVGSRARVGEHELVFDQPPPCPAERIAGRRHST